MFKKGKTMNDYTKESLREQATNMRMELSDYQEAYQNKTGQYKSPHRVRLMEDAIATTSGARENEYGDFQQNMDNLADMMTTYLICKYRGVELDENRFRLTSVDAAFFMTLVKMTRTFQETSNPKDDTFTDGACYFAMAGEAAQCEKDRS